jgi:hypothetical protein
VKVKEDRLGLWASVSSIHTIARMRFPPSRAKLLEPKLLSSKKISLGETLIFNDDQLIKILKKEPALPKLGRLFLSPIKSLLCLIHLWEIGKFYNSSNNHTCAQILLAGSLSAICVYLNCHRYAIKIFESERKHSLSVRIDDSDSGFLITFETRDGWICKTGKKEDLASASLTFKNKKIACEAAKGIVDPWDALITGDILLAGRITMLDKLGYVSRMVQNEIPRPPC